MSTPAKEPPDAAPFRVVDGGKSDLTRAEAERIAWKLYPGRPSAAVVELLLAQAGAGGETVEERRAADAALDLLGGQRPVPLRVDAAVLVRVADVVRERIEWLWPGRLARRKLTVLDGDPGLGKSTITCDLAARVSTGASMPGEAAVAEPAGVLMLSAEDGVADTIRPRLEAAGADLQRCVVMTASRDHQGRLHPVSLPADIPAITRAAQGISARLIVVDPLMAFLDGRVDAHRDQDVRGALRTLAELAEITGAALLILRHLNKAAGGNPIYRGGGSIGIIGAARVGLLVAPDPSDKARRVLAVTKSNLAAIPPALVYRLVPTNDTSAVQWEGEATCGAADLLAAQDETTEARGARQEAEVFLRDLLENGPVSAVDVKRQAAQAGVAWATVRRAADQIGVQRLKVGMKQGWFWSLPPEGDQ